VGVTSRQVGGPCRDLALQKETQTGTYSLPFPPNRRRRLSPASLSLLLTSPTQPHFISLSLLQSPQKASVAAAVATAAAGAAAGSGTVSPRGPPQR
jgi:hypothetical protein